jgi:hypothetical protein
MTVILAGHWVFTPVNSANPHPVKTFNPTRFSRDSSTYATINLIWYSIKHAQVNFAQKLLH